MAQLLRALHISPRHGVVYVNNAKVACSSIKLALQRAELDDQHYLPSESVHSLPGSPLLTAETLTAGTWRAALEGRYVFSFVRAPWGRLRSAYLNKIVTGQKDGNFRAQLGFDRGEVPSFEAFVHALGEQDPVEMNGHWRPQWINISHGEIAFDFLGRLESIAPDWARVSAATGLPFDLPRAGKSTAKDAPTLVFTPAMAEIVRAVYAEDFRRFDYPDVPD
ncbi:MAG: sulfotransferase family protein [Pseudomonadota bacterium]